MAAFWCASIALVLCGAEEKLPIRAELTSEVAVELVDPEQGKARLVADDDFTRSLSRFDMQSRMKTSKEVTLGNWKQFVAEHVRPWTAEEIEKVRASLARVGQRLANLRLPLPRVISMIRTTGDEEADAAYTRGTSIVLPTKVINYPAEQLDRLLAHELFHVMSRHDGAVRARLYAIIGFERCEAIDLPSYLAPRRITNPDAPLIDCMITLPGANGKTYTAAPILYSSAKQYDAERGASLFQSLVFRLLVVEKRGGHWEPSLVKGEPVVIDPKKESAFLEKIGKNTNYIIHPDEIMADNFVRLVMEDKDLPTPSIIDEMRKVLTATAPPR